MGCECSDSVDKLRGFLQHEFVRLLVAASHPREQWDRTVSVYNFGTVLADGTLVLDLGTPTRGNYWRIQRVSKHVTIGTVALAMFVGPQLTTSQIFRRDNSAASQDDIADEMQAIHVGEGEYLTAAFSSGTQNSIATVSCQVAFYRVGRPSIIPGPT